MLTQEESHAQGAFELSAEPSQVQEVYTALQQEGQQGEKRKQIDADDPVDDELQARFPTSVSPTTSSLARSDACQLNIVQASAQLGAPGQTPCVGSLTVSDNLAAQAPVSEVPALRRSSKRSRDKSNESLSGTSKRVRLRNAQEVANLITHCIVAGGAYFQQHEKHQRSWRCDLERDKPETAKLDLLEAISRQSLYTERTAERSTISLFVEGWLLIALEGVRRDERRRKLGTGGPRGDAARRTDTRKRKVGYAIVQLIKELSKHYGRRAYNVCTAIACRCI